MTEENSDLTIAALREELELELNEVPHKEEQVVEEVLQLRALQIERDAAIRGEIRLEKRLHNAEAAVKSLDEVNADLRQKNHTLLITLESVRTQYARCLQRKKKREAPHSVQPALDITDLVEVENRMDRALSLERERKRQASTKALKMAARSLIVVIKKAKGQAFRHWSSLTLNTAVHRVIGLYQHGSAGRILAATLKNSIQRKICRAFRLWSSQHSAAQERAYTLLKISRQVVTPGSSKDDREIALFCHRLVSNLLEKQRLSTRKMSTQTRPIRLPKKNSSTTQTTTTQKQTHFTQTSISCQQSCGVQTQLSGAQITEQLRHLEDKLAEEKLHKKAMERRYKKLQRELEALQEASECDRAESERRCNERIAAEAQRLFEAEKRCSELEASLFTAKCRAGDAHMRSMRLAARATRAEASLTRELAAAAQQRASLELKMRLDQDRTAIIKAECLATLHESTAENERLERVLKRQNERLEAVEATCTAALAIAEARDETIKDKVKEKAAMLVTLDESIVKTERLSLDIVNKNDKIEAIQAICSTVQATAAEREDFIQQILQRENSMIEQLRRELDSKDDRLEANEAVCSAALTTVAARDEYIQQKMLEADVKAKSLTTSPKELENRKQLETRLKDLEQSLALADAARRRMHNALQEARGNVRVVARLRGGASLSAEAEEALVTQQDRVLVRLPAELSLDGTRMKKREKPQHYCFDRAFGPSSTQTEVFEEVRDLVQSAVDGYHVSILAYGATNSGKTYTMYEDGIISRAAQMLAQTTAQLTAQGWQFALDASCVEVYEEKLYDLLPHYTKERVPVELREHSNRLLFGNSIFSGKKDILKRFEALAVQQEGPVIDGAAHWPLDPQDPNAIARLVTRAAKSRSTRSTMLNQRSSRSHSVFMIRLFGYHEGTRTATIGSLTLVDLAGSERCTLSGATPDSGQMREACAINRSLSCLVSVFTALRLKYSSSRKKQQLVHIPYRDSKLTYLLQNALAGDGKTLVCATLSPDNLSQSISTLRFASQVAQVVPNRAPKKNVVSSSSN